MCALNKLKQMFSNKDWGKSKKIKPNWNHQCSSWRYTRGGSGGCHCCQYSSTKWLTIIFRVEFSFLKMLRTRFSNLSKSSYGRHCSETLTSVGGYSFSCCPVFSTIRDSVQCTKCASLFQIFWAARNVLF